MLLRRSLVKKANASRFLSTGSEVKNHFNFSKRSIGYSFALGGIACLAVASIMSSNPNGNFTSSLEAQGPAVPSKVIAAAGVKGGVERTFIAVKPDGTQRGLVGKIIDRFETRGYKLIAVKSMVPSRSLAEVHYGDLKGRPFYDGLVSYMTSGKAPVIAMVWEGIDVIKQGRRIIGATNPLDADPGSIRGQYCISVGRNIIHGSDSFDSASVEIPLWFKDEELTNWSYAHEEWITSQN